MRMAVGRTATDKGPEGRKDGRQRRRRRAPKKAQPPPQPDPVRVIRESKTPLQEKPVDVPLSPREIAAMKTHFGFLKRHRKLLKLSFNATEDLLVNGTREPTHRGVCQHLLGKLDKARVLSAVERLSPLEARPLLEGIVRFSPDVAYLLLYVEAVERSGAQKEATAVLSATLAQLDYDEVSEAQMRRVLQLLVRVFSKEQRPQILFGLLRNAKFRNLFDESQSGLPSDLAGEVLPLRAAQAVVLQDRPNPCGLEHLRMGVAVLLQNPKAVLLGYSPKARERLLSLALGGTPAASKVPLASLQALVNSLDHDDRTRADKQLGIAIWLLASGNAREAERVLNELGKSHPKFAEPAHWLRALKSAEDDDLLILRGPRGGARETEGIRWCEGYSLARRTPAYITRGAGPEDAVRLSNLSKLYQAGSSGSVARLLRFKDGERPALAIERRGRLLLPTAPGLRRLERPAFHAACRDVAQSVASVSARGIALQGLEPTRLAFDAGGRLWLVDLFGATQTPPESASSHNTELLQKWLLRLAERSMNYLPDAGWVAAVKDATDCDALAACVAE